MATVLYLAHRLPYPPDKGDKVRTHHILRHLAARHRVVLATFIDDPADLAGREQLARWCDRLFAVRLRPLWAKLRALTGLLRGEALTLAYYRDRRMRAWVTALRQGGTIDAVVVSSSSMAPYAAGFDVPVVMDFIDVDSAKWASYAEQSTWPGSWIYAREARLLSRFEQAMAARASQVFFVTRRELALFQSRADASSTPVDVLGNGVDTDYFSPDPRRLSPFDEDELPLVFTGTMNYRPNIDAVCWFVRDVLPLLRQRWPALRLSIVGRHPVAAVRALAGAGVRVTGAVNDVRPWLQHAAVVVAPILIVRGLPNKILEAMAMGRPVVAASACAEALDLRPEIDLVVATEAAQYLQKITALLTDPQRCSQLGESARVRMQGHYSWQAQLAPLSQTLD